MDMAAQRGTLGNCCAPLGRSLWGPWGSQGGRFLTWGGAWAPVGSPWALVGGPRGPPIHPYGPNTHISNGFYYFSKNVKKREKCPGLAQEGARGVLAPPPGI